MSPDLQSVMEKLARAELPPFEGVALNNPNARSRNFGDTPLHIMAIWGDGESVRILIQEGAEIDARGEDDFTPLHNAVEQNKIEVVKLLLDSGANPNAETADENTAYDLAEILERREILDLLNERGRPDAAVEP